MDNKPFIVAGYFDEKGWPCVLTTCDRPLTPVEFVQVDEAVMQMAEQIACAKRMPGFALIFQPIETEQLRREFLKKGE